jgi:hypothetical protein
MTEGVAQRRHWTFYETVKVAVRRFQQQMLLVAHQAVGMNDCAISYRGRFQVREELFPILPTLEDILWFFSPRGHMVERARIFDSKGPGHRFLLRVGWNFQPIAARIFCLSIA